MSDLLDIKNRRLILRLDEDVERVRAWNSPTIEVPGKDLIGWAELLADALAVLTTGAEPRCPNCEAEVRIGEDRHKTAVFLCDGCMGRGEGKPAILRAIATGNRVALRAREAGGAA